MSNLNQMSLKSQVGEEVFSRLEDEAEKEVAAAMEMPLKDQWGQEKYYRPRQLLSDLLTELENFEGLGLKITPLDIVHILFKSKLLFAVTSEEEYIQRSGGSSLFGLSPFQFRWEERNNNIDKVIDAHITRLEKSITEKTLLVGVSHFTYQPIQDQSYTPSKFFTELFSDLELPFSFF